MESEFIHWLREHVPPDPRFPLRLNDDAALLSPLWPVSDRATSSAVAGFRPSHSSERNDIVVTTDLLTEGVDFYLTKDDPHRIGRKALAANLSDIAAMAARPLAAFLSLALPRRPASNGTPLALAIALYEGLLPLAAEFEVAIAGGDTNTYEGPLVISATLLGEVTQRGPLTRSGGRLGDWLLITGELGGSILGHSFDFTPRVREALLLHERYELHAGMDISDGLALDASRLAGASGCGAVLHLDKIPIAPAAYELSYRETAQNRQAAALQHALSDGEDFELLLAAAPDTAAKILADQPLDCPITHVGELVAEPGLWQQTANSARQPLEPIGWLH